MLSLPVPNRRRIWNRRPPHPTTQSSSSSSSSSLSALRWWYVPFSTVSFNNTAPARETTSIRPLGWRRSGCSADLPQKKCV
mmetsp:Transcript_94593/g.182461  ORF Transcript_94593/g.182461 Transcript_94593/m.182461 type:complete len:81 (+) Transcript_94593:262-504(+)